MEPAATQNSVDEVSSWQSEEFEAKKDDNKPGSSSGMNTDTSDKKARKKAVKKEKTFKNKSGKRSSKKKKKKKIAKKAPSSSSTSSKHQQNGKETTSPRSLSPSVDPWSTESIADYDVVHPVIRYNKARRTCAKMLVRAGLRCRCHFLFIAEFPSRQSDASTLTDGFQQKRQNSPQRGALCVCEPL